MPDQAVLEFQVTVSRIVIVFVIITESSYALFTILWKVLNLL
jgi:hypothetical protein